MMRDDEDDMQQPPYRVRDVARKFGVSEKSVRDAIAAGRIPAFRIGKSWLIPPKWVNRQVGEAAGASARHVCAPSARATR